MNEEDSRPLAAFEDLVKDLSSNEQEKTGLIIDVLSYIANIMSNSKQSQILKREYCAKLFASIKTKYPECSTMEVAFLVSILLGAFHDMYYERLMILKKYLPELASVDIRMLQDKLILDSLNQEIAHKKDINDEKERWRAAGKMDKDGSIKKRLEFLEKFNKAAATQTSASILEIVRNRAKKESIDREHREDL